VATVAQLDQGQFLKRFAGSMTMVIALGNELNSAERTAQNGSAHLVF